MLNNISTKLQISNGTRSVVLSRLRVSQNTNPQWTIVRCPGPGIHHPAHGTWRMEHSRHTFRPFRPFNSRPAIPHQNMNQLPKSTNLTFSPAKLEPTGAIIIIITIITIIMRSSNTNHYLVQFSSDAWTSCFTYGWMNRNGIACLSVRHLVDATLKTLITSAKWRLFIRAAENRLRN